MKNAALFLFSFFGAMLAPLRGLAVEPFRLPVGAVVSSTTPDGKGWIMSGHVDLTFVSARQRFSTAIGSAGWMLKQSIPLGRMNDRCLELWSRQDDELTIMLWRISVDRTGFSWGISRKARK